jgi:hypothetical protein
MTSPLERRAELVKLLEAQPWGDKSHRYFLTREQEYVGGLEAAVGIWYVSGFFRRGLAGYKRPC